MLKRSSLGIMLIASIAISLRAQTTNGLITGVVAASDANGLYIVRQLSPGAYTLTVMKDGFASVKQNSIQLLVNQSLTIDVKLSVASTAQTIEVNTAPPMLNTTSSTLSDVIEHEETVDSHRGCSRPAM